MRIDFRDAYCDWVVPKRTPDMPRGPDELHVAPKTAQLRKELKKALAGGVKVLNSADKAKYPRRYNVVREEAGVFVLISDGCGRWHEPEERHTSCFDEGRGGW